MPVGVMRSQLGPDVPVAVAFRVAGPVSAFGVEVAVAHSHAIGPVLDARPPVTVLYTPGVVHIHPQHHVRAMSIAWQYAGGSKGVVVSCKGPYLNHIECRA